MRENQITSHQQRLRVIYKLFLFGALGSRWKYSLQRNAKIQH
jgi:hypothetical protein